MDFTDIFNGLSSSFLGWVAQHGGRVVLILLVAIAADVIVRAALSKKKFGPVLDSVPRPKYKNIIGESQRRRIRTIIKALKDILSFVIWALAVITVLPEFGINVAPIIAGLGLAGLAVGMAAKDMITDLIAGFSIIMAGDYNAGDKIKIAGVTGTVREVSLRRTILQGSKGAVLIVPNREIKLIKRFAGGKGGIKTVEKDI